MEFRDAKDFSKVLYDHSTAPFIPYEMCVVSASKLCFEDYSKSPSVIRQLDCRFTPTNSSEVLIVPDETIYDMYFTTPGGHILLVACGIKGFKAYDIKKKQLEWSGSGKLNGLENALDVSSVTSDGQESIFVCDKGNSCVLVFSFSGEYISTLVKAGEQGVGEPTFIRWSNTLSSLFVAHRKDDEEMWVSVVKRRS